MKAATITANLKPQNDVYLIGYIGEDRKHPTKSVHDDPLSVALLLEINDKKLLFLSIDVIMMPKAKAEIIKNRICDVFDIDKDYIIINAIHSHSEPNGFNEIGELCTSDNEEYFAFALDRILESIRGLDEKLVNVDAYIDTTKVHGYYSNRNDISKPFEDHAAIIKFMQDDKLIAAMCNFNCHGTVLGVKNMEVSADLIGAVRSKIADEFGIIPYTFTGASGDISNRQYRQGNDFQELERVSKGIADILLEMHHYESLPIHTVSLQHVLYTVAYDNTTFYNEYENSMRMAKEALQNKDITPDEWKLRNSEIACLQGKLKVKDVQFTVDCKILHFDDLTMVTFPGELVSKFGLALRAQAKTKNFLLIGYADDYQGYFVEQEEYGKCYETIATNTPKGESEKIIGKIGESL